MALTIVTDATGVQDLRTLSWNCGTLAVGDIIVIAMATEDSALRPMNAPTATGVTFTQRVLDTTASHDWVAIYTGVVTSGGAKTVTATINWVTTSAMHNGVAYVCLTADGYSLAGTPNTVDTTGSGAPSATITDTSGNLIIGCNGDWNAVDGASRAYRGTTTEDLYSFITGASTNYFWHQTASGTSDTIGLTAPTGQAFTVAGVEVLFTSAVNATVVLGPTQADVTIHP